MMSYISFYSSHSCSNFCKCILWKYVFLSHFANYVAVISLVVLLTGMAFCIRRRGKHTVWLFESHVSLTNLLAFLSVSVRLPRTSWYYVCPAHLVPAIQVKRRILQCCVFVFTGQAYRGVYEHNAHPALHDSAKWKMYRPTYMHRESSIHIARGVV